MVLHYLKPTFTVLSQQSECAVVCMFPTSCDSWCGWCPKRRVVQQSHAGFIPFLKHVAMGVEEVFSLQFCKHKMSQAVRDELSFVCTDIRGSFFIDISHLWHWINIVEVAYGKVFAIRHLIMWYFRRVVPRLKVLRFARIKLHWWNRRIAGTCSEGHQQCLYIKHSGISWPLFSNSFSYEDSQNTDNPEQADKGDTKWRSPLISCAAQV